LTWAKFCPKFNGMIDYRCRSIHKISRR